MLYVVEIRREHPDLAKLMSGIREWLDAQRFDPQGFRCNTDQENLIVRLEFKSEAEALACAKGVRRSAEFDPRHVPRFLARKLPFKGFS
jgi:hypothetical protein